MNTFMVRVRSLLTQLPAHIELVIPWVIRVLKSRWLWTAVLLIIWIGFGLALIDFYRATGLTPTSGQTVQAFQVFVQNRLGIQL